jgi:hypothetical protein
VKETRAKGKGGKGLSGALSQLGGRERTVTRTYKTPMLILCTGKHVHPHVPDIPNDGSVPMIHSSQVRLYGGPQHTQQWSGEGAIA